MMNRALKRLLNKTLPDWQEKDMGSFLRGIDLILSEQDEGRKMLEHSLTLTSDELNAINEKLVHQLSANIDVRKKLEELVAKQQAILDASREAVFSFYPGGKLRQANKACEKLIGLSLAEQHENTNEENLNTFLGKLVNRTEFEHTLRQVDSNRHLELSGIVETKKGEFYDYISLPEFLNNEYLGRVWCFRDITEFKKSQDLLVHQAYHDKLTNLPNRARLLENLNKSIEAAKKCKKRVAVLFIDLDNFKRINDIEGHLKGDELLTHLSEVLSSTLNAYDTLGRFGGDEFIMILTDIEHQHEVIERHKKIINLTNNPTRVGQAKYFISFSVGVSMFPIDGDDPNELIRRSDMAMYEAKRSGKNSIFFFNQSLEAYAKHQNRMESLLREAIVSNHLFLEFQPKYHVNTKKIVSMEALVRWRSEDGSIIYPNSFIGIAEQIGLIGKITDFVVIETCKTLHKLKRTPLNNIKISFNISANDLQTPNFVDRLKASIAQFDLSGEFLVAELTESVFLNSDSKVVNILLELRELGVQLSVDDFGTGYSSFGYLKDMDVNYLKIDRSFVTDIHSNSKIQAISKSIIDIGNNLDMLVIAEGVETKEEFEYLKEAGCHIIQGYLFSKPVSLDKLISDHSINRDTAHLS